jgi:archaellum component FlaG (FlaF/FlaG flagellin family)
VDKTIVTAMLIIIGMIMAVALFNAAYPAIISGGDAMANMANRADDRLRSQVEIIHAAGELNSSGWWQDTNSNGYFDAFVWVKNVGSTRIVALESTDVFFGPEGNFARISHEGNAHGAYPNWSWQIENGTEWTPTATLKISIHYALPLEQGRYFIKIVIPNGIADDYFMGM